MHEYRYLIVIIVAIFAVTLLGAYFSPSFQEQKGYLELFFLFGAVLFVVSILAIFATLGFSSFSLYMAIILAFLVAMLGMIVSVLILLVTYALWGGIFAMEVLLFDADTPSAKTWFLQRYTYKSFKKEYYAFYPMLGFIYLLLEAIPSIFQRQSPISFSPSRVLKEMKEILK